MKITSDNIIKTAQSWVNVKWRHQGRTRAGGIDCIGLLLVVAKDLNIDHGIEFLDYKRAPNRHTLRNLLSKYLIKQNDRNVEPGKIGLFNQTGFYPCHVAIFGYGTIIHAYASSHKVIEHSYTDEWKVNLRTIFAYKELI